MIVDAHTHLWRGPDQLGPSLSRTLQRKLGARWQELDASPRAHGEAIEPVGVAFVLGFRSRYLGAEIPNTFVAEYVNAHANRLVGFGGLDPSDGEAAKHAEQFTDMGLEGVTIDPAGQDFHPAATSAMRFYEACEGLGMPIIVQTTERLASEAKLEFARPYLFDEVARSFPELKLVIGGMGRPWPDETFALVDKHPNVFTDLAGLCGRPWPLYNLLLQAYQLGVTDRLLFGSGFPFIAPGEAIEAIYSLNRYAHGTSLPSIPREKLRMIVERDTLDALGLAPRGRGPAGQSKPKVEAAASEDVH